MNAVVRLVLFLLTIILLIAGVVAIIRGISSSGPEEEPVVKVELTTDGSESKLVIRGPVVARENRFEVRLIINEDQRRLLVYRGDVNSAIETETLSNDSKSYGIFLGALEHNNVTDGVDTAVDPTGYCHKGEVYELTYKLDRTNISKWANTCDSEGDLDNERDVKRIFTDQFPTFEAVAEKYDLKN